VWAVLNKSDEQHGNILSALQGYENVALHEQAALWDELEELGCLLTLLSLQAEQDAANRVVQNGRTFKVCG